MSRTHFLDINPEAEKQLAELLYEGTARPAIADVFKVHPDTITDWKKRPSVQHLVAKLIQERANRILSQTDTKIEARLREMDKPSIELLLKIRHEYAGENVNLNVSGEGSKALQQLMEAVHEDPVLAKLFQTAVQDDSGA